LAEENKPLVNNKDNIGTNGNKELNRLRDWHQKRNLIPSSNGSLEKIVGFIKIEGEKDVVNPDQVELNIKKGDEDSLEGYDIIQRCDSSDDDHMFFSKY
jgi:hypothetical protein